MSAEDLVSRVFALLENAYLVHSKLEITMGGERVGVRALTPYDVLNTLGFRLPPDASGDLFTMRCLVRIEIDRRLRSQDCVWYQDFLARLGNAEEYGVEYRMTKADERIMQSDGTDKRDDSGDEEWTLQALYLRKTKQDHFDLDDGYDEETPFLDDL